jgi:hypothetical protein
VVPAQCLRASRQGLAADLRPGPQGRQRGADLNAIDWFFRNRQTGAITIGQWPNAPLLIFIGCALVGWLDGAGGRIGPYLRVLGAAALVWWAVDEVVRGVNPWRRCLGAGVLAFLVWKLARAGL